MELGLDAVDIAIDALESLDTGTKRDLLRPPVVGMSQGRESAADQAQAVQEGVQNRLKVGKLRAFARRFGKPGARSRRFRFMF